jgi:hypothetical protein
VIFIVRHNGVYENHPDIFARDWPQNRASGIHCIHEHGVARNGWTVSLYVCPVAYSGYLPLPWFTILFALFLVPLVLIPVQVVRYFRQKRP